MGGASLERMVEAPAHASDSAARLERAGRIRTAVLWLAVISSSVLVGVARVCLEAGPISSPALQGLSVLSLVLVTATAPHFAVERLAVLAVEDAGALAAAGHARRAGGENVVTHTHFHTHWCHGIGQRRR